MSDKVTKISEFSTLGLQLRDFLVGNEIDLTLPVVLIHNMESKTFQVEQYGFDKKD